ncbi:hypothetical protein SAMN05444266_10586 [Chitinophaga jiangningensis]|uniref:Uncharacterized protein n=1 Tax=Chitinophaga jiangningensis TaxID=1419482 RepID=A0A1M7DQ90_9BACT|nr:hypothetical protein [Chitinophaga jiangningensis]SHL81558.1 hypothetical protein SAMN05444266_10586 [Chitinophaga jiangningensis]
MVVFGKDKMHISSFVEVCCKLFDKNALDSFVDTEAIKIGFTNDIVSAMKILRDSLGAYNQKSTDVGIWADPEWLVVLGAAKKVLQLLGNIKIFQLKFGSE